MSIRYKFLFACLLLIFALPETILFAGSHEKPIHQLSQFGKTLQVSNANDALKSLLASNPFYPDGLQYADQLVLHYENLVNSVGKVTHFTVTQERELAKHLHYLQCYTEHAQGGIIWEFEFGLREQEWFLTKIYFAKQ